MISIGNVYWTFWFFRKTMYLRHRVPIPVAWEREDTMGIFSEADHHPFIEREDVVAEESHGGAGQDRWGDDHGTQEYVRPSERARGLFIRDDELAA